MWRCIRPVPGSCVSLDNSSAGFEINLTPVERIVRRTALVAAGEYRCAIDQPQFIGGGPETCPFIAFPRSSVRIIPDRGRAEACTPNTVNLLDVGDCYSRRPISPEGASCDWIAVAPDLLREMARAMRPRSARRSERVFERTVVPVKGSTFVAQRTFFSILNNDPTVSPLQIEETVFRLLERILSETHDYTSASAPRRAARRTSAQRQLETIERTKHVLAREFHLPLSIADLSRRVHCSAWHLSRSFLRHTGFTLHAYQQQLRLRASLQLLTETQLGGTGIASRLGFSSHSHFSNVFRCKFGLTPRQFTHACSRASLERLHAMLNVDKTDGARGYWQDRRSH